MGTVKDKSLLEDAINKKIEENPKAVQDYNVYDEHIPRN